MSQFMKEHEKYMDLDLDKTHVRKFCVREQVKNAKSSNPSVLQVKVSKSKYNDGTWDIKLVAKKTGKATVSFTAKGKKYKVNITVIKYSNPFAKLTVGGKDVTAKFNKSKKLNVKSLGGKKIAFKLKPGWKLSEADAEYKYKDENGDTCSDEYAIKNGTTLKKGTTSVEIEIFNKQMNTWREFEIEA